MSDARSGRVNALVCAILDANGDAERLAEQMRFFRDLTDTDIDRAMALAHWARTDGGAQLMAQLFRPFLLSETPAQDRVTA
jgi:hypothetical protein